MSEDSTVLGFEGGGTKTDWILLKVDTNGAAILMEGKLPAANFRLTGAERLRAIFATLPSNVASAGIYLAGCVTDQDRQKLLSLCRQIWPSANLAVGSDRDSTFAASFEDRDGISVISGTGSAVTGRKGGRIEKAAGRGHLLGDRGGAYVICIEGLRLALRTYDLEHRTSTLAESILRALALNRMEDLIYWAHDADKMQVSALAPVMFEAAEKGDMKMRSIIEAGAAALATYTASVARWLDFASPEVKLAGGLFAHHDLYIALYRSALAPLLPSAGVSLAERSGAWGAARLASKEVAKPIVVSDYPAKEDQELLIAETEQQNPRSMQLDRLPTIEMVRLFAEEEKYVQVALADQVEALATAVDLIASRMKQGGRLFYVGAGTSGRLGALDASEIPPTFGESSERIQAIIAGGAAALYRSIEGAEDHPQMGALAISDRGVMPADVVCGITASGRTPFVLGALSQARKVGADTILLTCNPARKQSAERWDVEIDLQTGPELLTGSTRLKAGTATKIALNILSTCSMVQLGKIKSNLMIDVHPSNAKLKQRAIQLVRILRNCGYEEALVSLEKNNWNVRLAAGS